MRCPACHHDNRDVAKFCEECGVALAKQPGGSAGRPAAAKPALDGERKQVTVLFVDVQGSMTLAEQMDAEAWNAIMQEFLAVVTDGVERFEGTVNQYMGDGAMALFGAPIAHEDHAQRACYWRPDPWRGRPAPIG